METPTSRVQRSQNRTISAHQLHAKRTPRGMRVIFSVRALTFALAVLLALSFAQTGSANSGSSPSTTPLSLSNNYLVTGDYVVGGVGLRGLGVGGFATGTITIPDAKAYSTSLGPQQVPAGADIVAAYLYWATVETPGAFAGQKGTFGPAGGTAYSISGTTLGNTKSPVSFNSAGCSDDDYGSKNVVAYRADVRPYLPLDANGRIQPNTSYQVSLADSGRSGSAPFTFGATLVIVYRVISTAAALPLNAISIYDGTYSPDDDDSTFVRQQLQGFYQAGYDLSSGISPVAKITHIVGNGAGNKFETVSFINDKTGVATVLPSLYGTLPPFPGAYNGSWDNPTWVLGNLLGYPVKAGDSSETTAVNPTRSTRGCVTWSAMILSTTVQDSDRDGLLDVWKTNQGYCDAGANRGLSNQGKCPAIPMTSDPSWIALPGAQAGERDLFLQVDAMCSVVTAGGTGCDTSNGGISQLPSDSSVFTNLANAFSGNGHGIRVHIDPNHQVIPEQTCTDGFDKNNNPVYCAYPNQAGVVGWKAGFEFLKTQPLNYPDEASCETRTPPGGKAGTGPFCVRRFPLGRRSSYHEVIFGNALGVPNWSFQGGGLVSIVASGTTLTFTTSTPHGLIVDPLGPNGRVTIIGAGSNFNLNKTFLVQTVPSTTSFTITLAGAASAPTRSSDPYLAISSGNASTGSGFSDLGGGDSLISLGLWGTDGQTVPVQSGTLMHELGHSLGLTHGGSYADTPGSYALTFEGNCKPNYQSVMNYLFQVDLLTDSVSLTDSVLDYSSEPLATLNENGPLSTTVLSGALLHPATKWYTPNQAYGSPATRHCDGSPILSTDQPRVQPMFRVEGPTNLIPWAATPQDINFDGSLAASLRGYNDWENIDLRQVGATGNDFWAGGAPFGSGGAPFGSGGAPFGSGGAPFGSGGAPFGSGGAPFGSGGAPFGSGGAPFGSGGVGEITPQIANSVVRAPSKLTGTLTSANFVSLNWSAPSFGQSQIAAFAVYRAVNGGAFPTSPYTTVTIPANTPLPLSALITAYTDQNVGCETYSYFITTILNDNRASGPSNVTPQIQVPCTFIGFLAPLTTAGTVAAPSYSSGTFTARKVVPIKWQLTNSVGTPLTDLNTLSSLKACPNSKGPYGAPPATAVCVTLYSGGTAAGKSTFTFTAPQFIFNWDTASTIGSASGYFTIELQLADGSPIKATTIKLKPREDD